MKGKAITHARPTPPLPCPPSQPTQQNQEQPHKELSSAEPPHEGSSHSDPASSGAPPYQEPRSREAAQPATRPVKGSKTGGPKTGGIVDSGHKKTPDSLAIGSYPLRGQDLNLRPPGYEPGELPNCSTPRRLI